MSVKLKLLRQAAGLTLEDLAQRAELTRSYLSKLERGLSAPSIASGLRIAKVLGVAVEELFSEAAQGEQVAIHRAPRRTTAEPHVPRIVSGALPDHRLVAFVLNPTDEPVRNHPLSHHRGEEILHVLKGSVTLQLAQRTETLHAGDTAHFNGGIPHRITSVGRTPASVLLVVAQGD